MDRALDRSEVEALISDPGEPKLRGAELAGADLSHLDLSKQDLSSANLTGTNLANTLLEDANLSRATLRDAVLFGARLDRAEFLAADARGANFSGCHAARTGFGGAQLGGACFFEATLTGATLSRARLQDADLRCARMEDARLHECDLRGTDASRSSLRGAELDCSRVEGANFDGADLRSSRLMELRGFTEASFIGADIRDTDFRGAYALRRQIIDENYLHEFRSGGRRREFAYQVWRLTSDCGRSFSRWALWTLGVVVLFAGIFEFVALDFGDHRTPLSTLYYSVVTLTTLGYGDVLPASTPAQIVAMLEVIVGYLALGGLISIFANKMARRGD